MKTKKFIGSEKDFISYYNIKPFEKHGMFINIKRNIYVFGIGYYYNAQRKGFWLTDENGGL